MTYEQKAKAYLKGSEKWMKGSKEKGFEFQETIFEYWARTQSTPVLKLCLNQFEEFFYNNTKSIDFLKDLIKQRELTIQN